jgi:hypothetical protein
MKKLIIPCLALALVSAASLQAKPPADAPGHPQPPPEAGCDLQRPPPSPLLVVLDTNHDGVISADEIANASQALLALDRNGDGQIDQEEMLPPRPDDAPESDAQPARPPRGK